MFSNDEEYNDYLAVIIKVYIFYIPAESFELNLSSILRATALDTQVLILYFSFVYIFGICMIIVLAFIYGMRF